MKDLRQQILAYLESNPGSKAKDIAKALGVFRAEVNQLIYGDLLDLLEQNDETSEWSLASEGVEYLEQIESAEVVADECDSDRETVPTIDISKELSRFQNRLLDLTNRNPLLNFRKSRVRTLHVVDELPDQIYDRLIEQNKEFRFVPALEEELEQDQSMLLDDLPEGRRRFSIELPPPPPKDSLVAKKHNDNKLQTRLVEEKLDRVLNRISRDALRSLEETGVNFLHLALGFLEWNDRSGSSSSSKNQIAPLILIPISIEKKFDERQGKYAFNASWTEEEVKSNISLAKRMENDFGLKIPVLEEGELPEDYFVRVLDAVRSRENWAIKRECVVGFFSFHKLMMFTDLENWAGKKFGEDSVVSQLICGTDVESTSAYGSEYSLDDLGSKDRVKLVLDADSSQHSALLDICNGQNLVIEGPPGTGKSQTITNAIATLMSQGKSVLFVAEKLAALNVVKTKLTNLGLGDFCLELHSDNATPRSVINSLEKRIYGDFYKPKRLRDVEDKLASARLKIADYLSASECKVGPYRASLHEVVWEIAELRSRGHEPLYGFNRGDRIDAERFEESIESLDALSHSLNDLKSPKESRWVHFSVGRLRPNQIPEVKSILEEMRSCVRACCRVTEESEASWGGKHAFWFNLCSTISSATLDSLIRNAPDSSLDCERLFEQEFASLVRIALGYAKNLSEVEAELSSRGLNSTRSEIAVELESCLKFFLPAYVGFSIDSLQKISEELPELVRIASELVRQYEVIEAEFSEYDFKVGAVSVDRGFLDRLDKLQRMSVEDRFSLDQFIDDDQRRLGREYCSIQIDLADLEQQLDQRDQSNPSNEGIEEKLGQFATEVLDPLFGVLGDQPVRSLLRSKQRIELILERLESAAREVLQLQDIGLPGPRNLSEWTDIEGTLSLYEHSLLKQTGQLSPALFSASASGVYHRAKRENDGLLAQSKLLSSCFHLASAPSAKEVREIQRVLRRSASSPFWFLNISYWKAKRALAEFKQPIDLPDQSWLQKLDVLASYLEAKERFAASAEPRDLFGPFFNGADSDWELLTTVMRWVATAKKRGITQRMHAKLVQLQEDGTLDRESLRGLRKQLELDFNSDVVQEVMGSADEMGWLASQSKSDQGLKTVDLEDVELVLGEVLGYLELLEKGVPGLDIRGHELLQDVLSKCNLIERKSALIEQINSPERWRQLNLEQFDGIRDWRTLNGALDWVEKLKAFQFPRTLEKACVTEPRQTLPKLISGLETIYSLTETYLALGPKLAELKRVSEPKNEVSFEKLSEVLSECEVFNERLEQLGGFSQEIGFDFSKDILQLSRGNKFLAEKNRLHDSLSATKFLKLNTWLMRIREEAQTVEKAVGWVKNLESLGLPEQSLVQFAKDRATALPELKELVTGFINSRSRYIYLRGQIEGLGALEHDWLRLAVNSEFSLYDLDELLTELVDDMLGLEAWAGFCRARDRCRKLELDEFVRAVVDEKLAKEDAVETFRLSVFEDAVGRQFERAPDLRNFTRNAIEQCRESFKDRDRELLQLNRDMIAFRASQLQPPTGISKGRVAEKTEMGLIKHEIGKQRRHVQIRNLLRRAGRSVRILKPCFMMSPLSVSQFLDPEDFEFDVVIMDEASQIKPEDALGAVLRANQLVVVGDPKQLPPTSFFDRTNEEIDEEDETQFDDNESILEVAMKTFHPIRRLRWHYRSQHESLIHFSNDRFYDGDLVIFPSSSKDSGSLGVYEHFVENGTFLKGKNEVEAKVVAQAIAEHARYCPDQSLGVGTFNMKQAATIQDELDLLCERDSRVRRALEQLEFRTEPLFIKNLENLQGDERDVIFISYTYGPDPTTGKVFNRFGPLAGEGGWRRLNVMVSRARKRVEVFHSIQPSDIKSTEEKSRGVRAFRDYLEFAQSGEIDKQVAEETTSDEPLDHFEASITRVVEKFGLRCKRKVGVAGFFVDLGVVSPYCDDTFLLGVVTDGAAYRESKSSRDRDRLRDEVIQSRNWRLHRVWAADWFMNQQNEEKRLASQIRALLEEIPKEFRQPKVVDEIEDDRYDDVDVCDQIIGHLKENGWSYVGAISGDVDVEGSKVERLLKTRLSPFVVFVEEHGWALKPELQGKSLDDVKTQTQAAPGTPIEDDEPGIGFPLLDACSSVATKSISEQLIKSETYQRQKLGAGRVVANDLMTVKILTALEQSAWKATVNALSEKVSMPPFRLRGMLPGIQRILNIDGQQVMEMYRESDTVELNVDLVRQEFAI